MSKFNRVGHGGGVCLGASLYTVIVDLCTYLDYLLLDPLRDCHGKLSCFETWGG